MAEKHPTDDIVRLAQARNPQEAFIWRDALENEGIRCRVVGDWLAGGFGEMSPTVPEVWVYRQDYDRARAILDAHQGKSANEEEE
jgi:hypothetical protein